MDNNFRGNRGRGGSYRGRGGYDKKQHHYEQSPVTNQNIEEACIIFKCSPDQTSKFTNKDLFNENNKLSGVLCRQEGKYIGSLYLTHINGQELMPPQIIYGTPKIESLSPTNQNGDANNNNNNGNRWNSNRSNPKNNQQEAKLPSLFDSLPSSNNNNSEITPGGYVLFKNKWNGTNVLFYKYLDNEGKLYITAKGRNNAILSDSPLGNTLSQVRECIQWNNRRSLTVDSEDLPSLLTPLIDPEVQSISFELCGNQVPHLVKYDFGLSLEPLFLTLYDDGKIVPCLEGGRDNPYLLNLSPKYRLVPSANGDQLKKEKWEAITIDELRIIMEDYQKEALKVNEKYRSERNMESMYWIDHFLIEGQVLFWTNEHHHLIHREAMYKVKPRDIQHSHWELFDYSAQLKVLSALDKIYEKKRKPTEESLRMELDISNRYCDSFWARHRDDIMDLIDGIPNRHLDCNPFPQVLILIGVPGSGKSTLAHKLTQYGWERVNQDDLGNRKACESRMEKALSMRKSVIVDRCNFDINQRHTWFKIASRFKVYNIHAIVLDIHPEICKQRVFHRTDHPTIPTQSVESQTIIDNFKNLMKPPSLWEGFRSITVLKTEEESNNVVNDWMITSEQQFETKDETEDGWQTV